ncbi:MAG TPA: hypothetical protein VGH85_09260 [Mycobacteriales bacterium]
MPAFVWLASVGASLKLFGTESGFFAEPLAVLSAELLPPLELGLELLVHAVNMAEPATAADPYKNLRRERPAPILTEFIPSLPTSGTTALAAAATYPLEVAGKRLPTTLAPRAGHVKAADPGLQGLLKGGVRARYLDESHLQVNQNNR